VLQNGASPAAAASYSVMAPGYSGSAAGSAAGSAVMRLEERQRGMLLNAVSHTSDVTSDAALCSGSEFALPAAAAAVSADESDSQRHMVHIYRQVRLYVGRIIYFQKCRA